MGRRYNDKPPRVTIPSERITEARWQQPLRERDARGKRRQKEYADRKRSAQYSKIGEGDHILLSTRTSTILSGRKEGQCCPYAGSGEKHQTAQFEPHEKVYPVSPSTEATEGHGGDEGDEIPTEGQSKATALIPPTYNNKHPTPPPESSASPVPSRLTRVRRPSSWMNDFVSFWA